MKSIFRGTPAAIDAFFACLEAATLEAALIPEPPLIPAPGALEGTLTTRGLTTTQDVNTAPMGGNP